MRCLHRPAWAGFSSIDLFPFFCRNLKCRERVVAEVRFPGLGREVGCKGQFLEEEKEGHWGLVDCLGSGRITDVVADGELVPPAQFGEPFFEALAGLFVDPAETPEND